MFYSFCSVKLKNPTEAISSLLQLGFESFIVIAEGSRAPEVASGDKKVVPMNIGINARNGCNNRYQTR